MLNPTTNGALAVANDLAGGIAASDGTKTLGFTLVTFDPSTAEGAEILVNSCLRKPLALKDHANTVIRVRHIVQHDVETVDERGEVSQWNRTVIVDDRGTCYQCGSEGVEKALRIMRLIRKDVLPFDPPVTCTVKLETLDGGKQWMYLDPDMKSLLTTAKGKK